MQLIRTLASYYRQSHLHLLRAQVPLGRQLSVVCRPGTSPFEQACRHFTGHAPAASHRDNGLLARNDGVAKADGGDSVGAPPLPTQAPRKPRFYTWAKWALGSFIALLVSLWSTRWQKLLLIESPSRSLVKCGRSTWGWLRAGEVENVVKVVETAAEVVEEVAAAAEKVSAEVAEKLPQGGKLKEVALAVEKASMAAVAGAETVEDIIHKVDELEEEVKALLKPVMDSSKTHK